MRRGDEIIRLLSKSELEKGTNVAVDDIVADFVQSGSNTDVNNFFVQCRKKLLNGNDFISTALIGLIKAGMSDRIRALWEACPPQSIMHRFYQMAVALSDFDKYDLSRAPELLRDALIESIDAGDSFVHLGEMIQICFHMESVVWPSAARFPKPSLEILGANSYGNSPYTCVLICDPVYCRYYAERFIGSLRQSAGNIDVFALVVNPDRDALDLLRTFDGVTIAKTEYVGEWMGEFCVSARFILANDMMRAIRSPSIFIDVDSVLPEGSHEFLLKISEQPLCYAEFDDLSPMLKVVGGILGARPCEDAERFWDYAADCMREGMAREGWLWALDQFSLYRTVCHGLQGGWNMVRIDELLEQPKGFIVDFLNRFLQSRGAHSASEAKKKRAYDERVPFQRFWARQTGVAFAQRNRRKNTI